MADDVRARLIYDVSAAQSAVKSLGTDLDRLEKPVTLSIVVNDEQLTEAVENVQTLKEEVANLVGLIALDDSQLAEAEAEVGTIDEELAALDGAITIDDAALAETDAELAALNDELSTLDGTITIDDTDVAAATTETDALAGSLGEVASGLGDIGSAGAVASGELGTVSGVTDTLGTGMAVAAVGVADLAEGLGATLPGGAKAAVTAIAGLAAGLGVLGAFTDLVVEKAIDAESATQRFHLTFGALASDINKIDVGGLTGDLSELAVMLGSDDDAIRQADASLGQLGKNAGATAEDVAKTVEQVNALAVRAVALNPELGTVGEVVERLGTSLARGGKFASQFGLALTANEINTRAAAIAAERMGVAVDDAGLIVTQFDKQAAGAAISVEKLGTQLGKDVAAGAENVAFKFSSLRQAFEEFQETVGKPLISPTLELLQSGFPIGADLATLLGEAAQSIIPAIGSILRSVEPLIRTLTDSFGRVLQDITPTIDRVANSIALAFGDPATVRAVEGVAESFGKMVTNAADLAEVLTITGPLLVSLAELTGPFQKVQNTLNDWINPIHLISTGIHGLTDDVDGVLHKISGLDQIRAQIAEGNAAANREAQQSATDAANAQKEATLSALAEKEAVDQVASSMREAKVSVDDLSKALAEAFKAPTQFDVAEAQAKFVKDAADARAKVAKEGGLSLIDPKKAVESFALLDKLTADFQALTDAQIKVGKFSPEAFDAGKAQLIELGKQLGLTGSDLDLFASRINSLPEGKTVEVSALITVAEGELNKLTKTEDIIAFLKQNPEVKSDIEVNGTEGLKEADKVKTALDVIDGRKTNAEVGIDDQTQGKADEINRRVEDLDALNAEPQVSIDDTVVMETIDGILLGLRGLDGTTANPTIGANDQASGTLDRVQAKLAEIQVASASPDVTVRDNASSVLGNILTLLRIIQTYSKVNVAVEAIRGFGFEEGGIVSQHQMIEVAEGNKAELVLPLEKPWERQLQLLDEAGVLAKLEEQFTSGEQARASVLNRAVEAGGIPQGDPRPSMRDLEAIASRMEEAARIIAAESRPITASITVPSIRDEHETARILRRKLVRL